MKVSTSTRHIFAKKVFLIIAAIIIATIPVNNIFALSSSTLNKYAENNILFYDGDSLVDCFSVNGWSGKEVTWKDLEGLDQNARLKLIVETYGPLAMVLQSEYGIPWELPFAMMVKESSVGTGGGVSSGVQKNGYYNMMGMKYSKNNHYAETVAYKSSSGEWAQYKSISAMIVGWAIGYLRNGAYGEGLKYMGYTNFDLSKAVEGIVMTYAPPSENDTELYITQVLNLMNSGVIGDVKTQKGWPSATELASSSHMAVGGKWANINKDIREEVYAKYGTAGVSSSWDETGQSGDGVILIGDQVAGSAKSALENSLLGIKIYYSDGRKFNDGSAVLEELGASDTSYSVVVYALGTNDKITKTQVEQIINEIGSTKKIVFVNQYSDTQDYTANNSALAAAAASNSSRVIVADWYTAASNNADYLSADGTSLTETGAQKYAEIISNAVANISGVSRISSGNNCRTTSSAGAHCYSEGTGCTDDGYTYFSQSDSKWGSQAMSSSCAGHTIATSGCGVAATAMVYTALSGNLILPNELLAKLKSSGQSFYVCGQGGTHNIASIAASEYNMTTETISLTKNIDQDQAAIEKVLNSGGMVVVVVGSTSINLTSNSHFIAIRKMESSGTWKIFTSGNQAQNSQTFSAKDILEAIYKKSTTFTGVYYAG